MSKILIVGGGNSGTRYCCGLLLYSNHQVILSSQKHDGKTYKLAKEYKVPFYILDELKEKINQFDLIILSVPLETKKDIFLKMVVQWGYRHRFILEKPLALTENDLWDYVKTANKYGICYIVGYQKRYFLNKDIIVESNMEILYPSFKDEKLIIHNLAHALDLCMRIMDIAELTVESEENGKEYYVLNCHCNGKKIKIVIHKTDDFQENILVNGTIISWPNLETYSDMVQIALGDKIKDYSNMDLAIARVLNTCLMRGNLYV